LPHPSTVIDRRYNQPACSRLLESDALRPAPGKAGPDLGGNAPLLRILQIIDDQKTHDLAHFIARFGVTEIRAAHGEGERITDWDIETEPKFFLVHKLMGSLLPRKRSD